MRNTGMSGSGVTYTVTVSTGAGNGTVRLNLIDDDSIVDWAANSLGGPGVGNGNYMSGEIYLVRNYPIYLPLMSRN